MAKNDIEVILHKIISSIKNKTTQPQDFSQNCVVFLWSE